MCRLGRWRQHPLTVCQGPWGLKAEKHLQEEVSNAQVILAPTAKLNKELYKAGEEA